MNLIHSLLGRRKFLIAFISSILAFAFANVLKLFVYLLKGDIANASDKSGEGEKKSIKAIVVYYSATGSTAKVARAIRLGMNGIIECDIAMIKKIDPKEMENYDVIAIGGPIWGFRETANLRLFVYNMPHMAGKLCIPFCTHGAAPTGFFASLSQPLRKKGLTIIGWNDWYGSVFHVLHMPKPYLTDGHPDDIDLREAEAFGREMAERALRIYGGEKELIPEIPTGPNADSLWTKHPGRANAPAGFPPPGMEEQGPGGGMPESFAGGQGIIPQTVGLDSGREIVREYPIPHFDLEKCIYPRCTACMDNCTVNAIDFSRTAPQSRLDGSSILIQGCEHCSFPLCVRSCAYDAIGYDESIVSGRKGGRVIDMDRCIFPECTLCSDNCAMNSIDFSYDPPVVHNNCEGCDLCWCVCPKDAVEVTNMEYHADKRMTSADHGFNKNLTAAEAKGKFRRLVPTDKLGFDNPIFLNSHVPRVVLHEGGWPDMWDKDGNLIDNHWPRKEG